MNASVDVRPARAADDEARDALDVLAPLADRCGLNQLKTDLEDAAFERLAPATRRRSWASSRARTQTTRPHCRCRCRIISAPWTATRAAW